MNNFNVIYKILQHLERMLDYEHPDMSMITPEALKISETRYQALMVMLIKNGYVEGAVVRKYTDSESYVILSTDNMRITLKGLEYLYENSIMRKIAQGLTGAVEIVSKLK